MQRGYADAYLVDDGRGWRRVGTAAIAVGMLIALLGLTTLTLAAETWSGYVAQGVIAMALGTASMTAGWVLLRHGDRLGPRIETCAVSFRAALVEPPATPARVRIRVPTLSYGALPRGS